MKLLLDTHVFLWLRNAPEKIPPHIMTLYEDIQSDVFLSMASIWEMQIKNQLGKLALDLPLNELIDQQCMENGLQILGIETGFPSRVGQVSDSVTRHFEAHMQDFENA